MKKFFPFLLILTLLLLLPALPASALTGTVYLRDHGGTLTDGQRAEISAKLEKISLDRGCDVAVVTLRKLGGRDVQRYAHELYDIHEYGQGSGRDGILLLISVTDREYAFSTNGYVYEHFSDAALDLLQEDLESLLSDDDYMGAIETFADNCDYLLELARAGKDYNPFPWIIIPISLVLGFLIALVSVSTMKRKLKPVHPAADAQSYVREGSLNLRDSRDIFLYSTVTRVPRPKSNSSGGSGRSGGFSGGSRGGRSGHF